MNNKEVKPKCGLCGKKGDEPYYIWTRGALYHVSCYLSIDWSLFKDKYERVKPEILRKFLEGEITDKDCEEYKNNSNYINALIGRFYKECKVDPEILREEIPGILDSKIKLNKEKDE